MLRHLLENTAYTLAQSHQKNSEMTNLAFGNLCEDGNFKVRQPEPINAKNEKEQTKRNNVQKRIFMKEFERKSISCRSTP